MLHHNHHRQQKKVSEDCAERETEDDIACTFGLSSENEERGKARSSPPKKELQNYILHTACFCYAFTFASCINSAEII